MTVRLQCCPGWQASAEPLRGRQAAGKSAGGAVLQGHAWPRHDRSCYRAHECLPTVPCSPASAAITASPVWTTSDASNGSGRARSVRVGAQNSVQEGAHVARRVLIRPGQIGLPIWPGPIDRARQSPLGMRHTPSDVRNMQFFFEACCSFRVFFDFLFLFVPLLVFSSSSSCP